MVQEYAEGGDLFSLLQKYGGRLSERVAVQMVLEPFLRVLQVNTGLGGGVGDTRCIREELEWGSWDVGLVQVEMWSSHARAPGR